MVSARCAYCDATLQPNSMYCASCGQLVASVAPPAPAAPAPVRPTRAKASAPAPEARRDGGEDVPLPGALPWQAPRLPRPSAAVARTVAVERVELVLPDGHRAVLTGRALIGRKPGQEALAIGAQAIEVTDAGRSVSRVHLAVELVDGRIMVADTGSSNGSSIEHEGRLHPLQPGGAQQEAQPGDVLVLGDVRIQVA
ncbi:FHA domain-containing protein [Agrococcus sp. KRD186]|jgi:hypothetical protein|uniref:FHA domain-containing protein n=1 Tax=Agrococcus sp. KRD186 TaxID=2729730 RepID=UPI0019CF9918|nr:FHA domain-containing protein [Agrococcus sp. KRD186]